MDEAVQTQAPYRSYSVKLGDEDVTIEVGRLAQQAGGSVTVRQGDTMLFCSATMSDDARDLPFFPLTVEYEEKMYAAGKIPGGFLRREGRPADSSILISRVIDRTLRPLFPDKMRNDVQVIIMSFSHDGEHQIDMLGMLAASTALTISNIPWNGPVAGVRIGYIDGKLIVNPSLPQMEESLLDLRVAGTIDAINMVECGAQEVEESVIIEAMSLAHEIIRPVIELQNQIRADIGKEKSEINEDSLPDEILEMVRQQTEAELERIVAQYTDRHESGDAIKQLEEKLNEDIAAKNAELPEEEQIAERYVHEAVDTILKEKVRARIIQGIRPDGRDYTTIRSLSAAVGLIPRVHGSGLFQRGETQVLTIATLGTPRDSQFLDGLDTDDNKRYIHHYNFPPYSTGEVYPMRGPKRREIGHGALAETALRYMIPSEEDFPYTLRLVSEVMSSNGSTSMASVCGSTLALMDAGVPIERPVAGIAMGLIKEGDDFAVLTDIQGLEDHLGDMDFKVAGTEKGITALQMDIKIKGVSDEIMSQALAQARDARMKILGVMTATLPAPREEMSEYAPRMITTKISVDKIGAVIGQGGKVVRSIQEDFGVTIEISDEGLVFIAGPNSSSVYLALEKVRGLVEEPELGQIYTGKVTRVESYGAFVEFLPGNEGMVHISQLADYRVKNIEDEVKLGDEIMVMVTDVDPVSRKTRLSRQAVLEGWTLEEARSRDKTPSGGRSRGGDRRRNDNRRNDNRRNDNRNKD